MFKTIITWVVALIMIAAGTGHLIDPEPWMVIVPAPLPPLAAVYASGVFEILGGLGVLIPRTRKVAGYGLVALFIAVFPANINAWWNDLPMAGTVAPSWFHWIRLPFQAVLMYTAWWIAQPTSTHSPESATASQNS
jgi:uncharacterized membrane protein